MKKIIAIMLVLVIGLLAFTACNKEDDDSQPTVDYGNYEPVEKFDGEKLKETWSIGEITFANENKITLPCTVREFIENSGMRIPTPSVYEGKMYEPNKTFTIQLMGEDTKVRIECKNLGTDKGEYLDATVVGYSFRGSDIGNRQMTVAGGLTVGVSRADVEAVLGIPDGKTQEDSMYTYKKKGADNKTVRLSISFNSSGNVGAIVYKSGK